MKNVGKFLEAFLAALVLLSFATLVHSSPLLLTKKQIINESDSIVVGKVLGEDSEWDSAGKFIVSYVKVLVLDDIKGVEETKEILVKRVGGRVGNREMIVHGAPKFRAGEKAVLFLKKGAANVRKVFGMKFGKLGIIKNALGEEVTVDSENSLHLLMKGANGKSDDYSVWSPTSLENLLGEIKEELNSSKNAQ